MTVFSSDVSRLGGMLSGLASASSPRAFAAVGTRVVDLGVIGDALDRCVLGNRETGAVGAEGNECCQ